MKRNRVLLTMTLLALWSTVVLAAPASPNYRLPWAVLDGGGGVAVSTSYRVAATFQSDASAASSSPSYLLASGFFSPPDTDADLVRDFLDNCMQLANPDQLDTDGDHYGNRCDADLNNSGLVNTVDFGIFKQAFGSSNADADFNGDGHVNTVDFGIFKQLFGKPPGPSGLVP